MLLPGWCGRGPTVDRRPQRARGGRTRKTVIVEIIAIEGRERSGGCGRGLVERWGRAHRGGGVVPLLVAGGVPRGTRAHRGLARRETEAAEGGLKEGKLLVHGKAQFQEKILLYTFI